MSNGKVLIFMGSLVLLVLIAIGINNSTLSFDNIISERGSAESIATESNSINSNNLSEEEKKRKEFDSFFDKLNEAIAQSHNIDLKEYTKIDVLNLEHTDLNNNLALLYLKLPTEVGDKKPTVYLNNNHADEGLILLQKADGMNVVYYIGMDSDESWIITEEKAVQGKLMNFDFKGTN